jgi:hypothetical protein
MLTHQLEQLFSLVLYMVAVQQDGHCAEASKHVIPACDPEVVHIAGLHLHTTADRTPSLPPIPQKCPNTLDSDSRQRLALILQNIYKAEGNPITVTAAGENCDILQLSGMLTPTIFWAGRVSFLISLSHGTKYAEGNHMMEAAERETIYCADCMLVYKKTKFKAIHFLGPDLNLEYSVE